jgi:8-oxo-dGTP diphosphatase
LYSKGEGTLPKFHYMPTKGGNCLCNLEDFCMCTPSLAIDVIIESPDGGSVVLVRRQDNGKFATIGGFVEVNESVEDTVARELGEETGLVLQPGSAKLFGLYSDPRRDHRRHTVSVAYIARAKSLEGLRSGSDAKTAEVVPYDHLLSLDFAFDHKVLMFFQGLL